MNIVIRGAMDPLISKRNITEKRTDTGKMYQFFFCIKNNAVKSKQK